MATEQAVNPLAILASPGSLKEKPEQLKNAFNTWVVTKAPWVEAAASGTFGAFQGAFLGALMGSMTKMNADVGAGGQLSILKL